MLPTLIDVDDIARWLGLSDFEEAERERAETVANAVSALAREEASRPEWDYQNTPEGVKTIILMASVRVFENPSQNSSITVEELTRRWRTSAVFEERELVALRGWRPIANGGLWSIQYTVR